MAKTIEEMREYIKEFCSEIGNCEKCDKCVGFDTDSCYTHCTDEEIKANYYKLCEKGY